jgi:hypothetical protein
VHGSTRGVKINGYILFGEATLKRRLPQGLPTALQ